MEEQIPNTVNLNNLNSTVNERGDRSTGDGKKSPNKTLVTILSFAVILQMSDMRTFSKFNKQKALKDRKM